MSTEQPPPWEIGTAIRAHCDEGEDFASDWWHWEQRPGRIRESETSQAGAGHLHHWKADLTLARNLHYGTLLASLSWARLQPERDNFSEEALEHYRAVFAEAREKGIDPVCVPWDTALPRWFTEAGGWRQHGAPGQFARYVRTVAEALGPYCNRWVPAFEPAWWLDRSSVAGEWPGGVKGWWPARNVAQHLAKGLEMAVDVVRNAVPGAQLGHSVRWRFARPADPHSPWDFRAAQWADHRWNHLFLAYLCARGKQPDFIVPAYGGEWTVSFRPLGFRRGFLSAAPRQQAENGEHPARRVCAALAEAGAGMPVLWLDHGTADDDDARSSGIFGTLRALESTPATVRGYVYGRFLDGFEWTDGYTLRRGLVHVDRDDLCRTPNPSAFLLQEYAVNGRFLPGTVHKRDREAPPPPR